MKIGAAACIFLTLNLIVGSGLAQSITCDKDSAGALKYIETWQTGTVVATTKPSSGWPVCATVYGTAAESCCNSDNLKMSFKKLAETVRNSWNMFLGDIAKFKMNAAKLKMAAGGSDVMARAETYNSRLKGLTSAQASLIIGRLDKIDDYVGMLKSKAAPCFSATLVARTNLICAACVKNADVMTDSGMHTIFKYKAMSCNSLVEACYPVWDYMLKLQATVLIAHEIRRGTGGSAPMASVDLPNSMTFGSLFTINQKCLTGKPEGSCTQADIDGICATNLNLVKAEPTGMGVNGTDFNTASARLLAGHTIEGFGMVSTTNAGVDLKAETMALDTSATLNLALLDGIVTQSSGNNSGNILMISFLGLVVAAISH